MNKTVTRKELKSLKASDFKSGDRIECRKYLLCIEYTSRDKLHTYSTPMCSYIINMYTGEMLDCTPGVTGGRPYYINDFLGR